MKDVNPNVVRIVLGVLALALLAVAVILTVTDNDATVAWSFFSAIVGAIVGQNLPTPRGSPLAAPGEKLSGT